MNKLFCSKELSRFVLLIVLIFSSSVLANGVTFTVINTNDNGAGSLRQALLDANANLGLDTIVFNIAPGGVQIIPTVGALPRITDPVIIDATTQPNYAGTPVIVIAGGSSGLTIDAGNTIIRGLSVGGIAMYTNGGNRIEGNFIGTNITGTAPRTDRRQGIQISNSSNNVIGGTSANARNLISGNSSSGVSVNGTSAVNNIIQGNYIGTDLSGTVAIPNEREGICLCSTNGGFAVSNNLIGGVTAGAGNVIAGNLFDEIRISGLAVGNTVQGNLIGTNASGTQSLPSNGYGISLEGATSSIIGGAVASARNIISSNISGSYRGGSGINIERASGNIIQGNFIGTDITGTRDLPNSDSGIKIFENSQNNVIGGTIAGAGNVISFNRRAGIAMGRPTFPDLPVINNSVRGNFIFFNGELGIDLTDNTGGGVTQNDPCDSDTGINNLQNYPVLASAISNGITTNITGSLNSTANTTFAIDFFANPSYDSSNFGEGKIYIGSANVTSTGSCNADFNVTLPYRAAGKQFITATATDSTGNTSEFSQYIRASGTSFQAIFDFDGDGKSEISVFRPDSRVWHLQQSQSNYAAVEFGLSTDKIVPADFDGDGKTDIAVFRENSSDPGKANFYILQSSNNQFREEQFGASRDIPVAGDWDGDGKADIGVYRAGTQANQQGYFYYRPSSQPTVNFIPYPWGIAGDKPVIADFDGDGKVDPAVFRPSNGAWYIHRSRDGFYAIQFGAIEDKPVVGDYDGDGKADQAVFRPSNGVWYIWNSTSGFAAAQFGVSTDKPVPADYDDDGKTNLAVYRDGNWFILNSTSGFAALGFGNATDKPIANSFVP